MIYALGPRMAFVGWVMYFAHMRSRGKAKPNELAALFDRAEDLAMMLGSKIERLYALGKICESAWGFLNAPPGTYLPKLPSEPASKPPRDHLSCRIEFIGHVFRQGNLRYRGHERRKLPGLLANAIWFSVAQFPLIQRFRRTGDVSMIAYEFFHAYPNPMLIAAPNEHYERGIARDEDETRRLAYEKYLRGMPADEFAVFTREWAAPIKPDGTSDEACEHQLIRATRLRAMSDEQYATWTRQRRALLLDNLAIETRQGPRYAGPRFRVTKKSSWETMRRIYFSSPAMRIQKTPHLS